MILFVDDEPEYVENYEIALNESHFSVKTISDVDEALKFIDANPKIIQAIVLDVMMSFGTSFGENETDGGTRTGVLLYKKLRETLPTIPVFALTNVSDDGVKEYFEAELNCYFSPKRKPFEFAKFVKEKIGGKNG
jgi:DNA-binding response OmpR family regulator